MGRAVLWNQSCRFWCFVQGASVREKYQEWEWKRRKRKRVKDREKRRSTKQRRNRKIGKENRHWRSDGLLMDYSTQGLRERRIKLFKEHQKSKVRNSFISMQKQEMDHRSQAASDFNPKFSVFKQRNSENKQRNSTGKLRCQICRQISSQGAGNSFVRAPHFGLCDSTSLNPRFIKSTERRGDT